MTWHVVIAPGITLLLAVIAGAIFWGKVSNVTKQNTKAIKEIGLKLGTKMSKEDCEKEMDHGDKSFGVIIQDVAKIRSTLEGQATMLATATTNIEWIKKELQGDKGSIK